MNKQKQNHALHAAAAVLVIGGGLAVASARESRTTFTVGATVNAVARLELQSAPSTLDISAEDVRRGYLEVAQPTDVIVRSNSREGFALELMTVAPMMSSVVVRGLGSAQSLGAEGGTIVQRWHGPHTAVLSLKFRLILAPQIPAGRYPWPMRLAVRPLESI